MDERNISGLPKSIACPECGKSGQKGKLELLKTFDFEKGQDIFYALCTGRDCAYHSSKMPLFMYERACAETRK